MCLNTFLISLNTISGRQNAHNVQIHGLHIDIRKTSESTFANHLIEKDERVKILTMRSKFFTPNKTKVNQFQIAHTLEQYEIYKHQLR